MPKQGEDARRARLLSLIDVGRQEREARTTRPLVVATHIEEEPHPDKETPPAEAETEVPPAQYPEPISGEAMDNPIAHLERRKRGLRNDPGWIGTTIYLRKPTHKAAKKAAESLGIDLSRLVEFCVSMQMREESRAPELRDMLGLKQED